MSNERQIDLENGDVADVIAVNTGLVDGFFRATLIVKEKIYLEVPEDSAEADCLRSGLADKIGQRVLILKQNDENEPFRIALKRGGAR